ncbi:MAG TPA: BTAD domain-containing putative transcriptional regulator, partial [Anaerolineales bacterium]|nr:BTAD domain-containing putative transcriptional regulator [Anaerolineales bacterium]
MTLEVRLLGTFHVKSGTKIVVLTSRSAQSLFAFLILHAGTSFRREKLAGLVWPETTEENARDYLRHALWRIRKSLQEASSSNHLKADDLAVAFDATSDYWLDVNAIQEADESGPPEDLMEVLAAYNGEFLPGFYEEWVATEREQVQAVYERKMASLLDLLEAGRRWSEVLEWGERWIANGQKPEAAYRHLMTAHAAKGDMAKAAAAYERCQKALAEYGMEPSEQTVGLLREIKAGQHTIQPTRLSVRPAGSRPVSRIPIPLTGFIGREKELAEIARLLGGTRLLTLLGPGGVGKTRLAIETAGKLERAFRDGVCWVDLVGLSDRELVPQAVRRAAGAPDLPGQDSIGTLTEHFAHRQCLLILDNCEHLISACAQMAAQLLAGSRQLKILATSREALDILGETTWTVPSLSLPTGEEVSLQLLPGFESVHLLLERIADARPGFELTEQNAPAVVHICNRLSGIPLALELAAARSRMMSVEEIASRLQESFDILTAGNRFALPRHQTLRATIDWSHQLLTAQEQILFRRLAIFAGGFTLEAAEEIAADETLPKAQILNALGHLIAKSMVSMQSGASGSPTRYFMLETIRQFAREQLDRTEGQDALRERHLEYF